MDNSGEQFASPTKRRLSLSQISDGKNTVPDLKKKLKILKQAIVQERQEFQEYRDQKEQEIIILQNQLNGGSNSKSLNRFDDFANLPTNSGIFDSDQNTPNRSLLKSQKSVGTEKLLLGVSHYLNSGMAKYYKSPENLQEENGEVYDMFYSLKQIKLLKDKLQQKCKQYDELKLQLEDNQRELFNSQISNGSSNFQTQQVEPHHHHSASESDVYAFKQMNKLSEIQEHAEEEHKPSSIQVDQQDLQNIRNQLEEQQKQLEEQQKTIEEQQKQLSEQGNQEGCQQEKIQYLETQLLAKDDQIELLQMELDNFNKQENDLQERISMTQQQQQTYEEEKKKLEDEIQSLQIQNEELISLQQFQKQQELDYNNQLNYQQLLEGNITRLNDQIFALKEDIRKGKKAVTDKENQYRMLQIETDKKDHQIQCLGVSVNEKEEEIQELQDSFKHYELKKRIFVKASDEEQSECGQSDILSVRRVNTEISDIKPRYHDIEDQQEVILRDFTSCNFFMRVTSFGEYVLQFETNEQNFLILGRDILSVKTKDDNLKYNEFCIIYVDQTRAYGSDRVRAQFLCKNKIEFEEVTEQVVHFVRESRLKWQEKKEYIKQHQQNGTRNSQEKTGYISGLFNFFGNKN